MTQQNPKSEAEKILMILDQGQRDEARQLCRAAFEKGAPSGDPVLWARVCEAAGLSSLALQAWQAVISQDPRHVEALGRLARLHEDRGDHARAAACRARLGKEASRPEAPDEAPHPDPSQDDEAPDPAQAQAGDGDIVRFLHLFAGRAGVHARQWQDRERGGGYSPVATPLSTELVRSHLEGGLTLGIYVVRHDNTVGQLIFDLDARKEAVEAAWGSRDKASSLRKRIHDAGLELLRGLRAAGFDPLLEDSGFKGRHLWCFFPDPEPAARARALGQAWARALAPKDPELEIEVFPKQDSVPSGGLGNLVKIPLGIHKRTDRRCVLLDDSGQVIADPWARLRAIRRVPLSAIRLPAPVLLVRNEAAVPQKPKVEESLPAPAAEAPIPFSEADLETRPRLAAILSGCQPLRAVVRKALTEKLLHREERITLEHTIGHFPEGVEAFNYLMDRCCASSEDHMGNPHRGSPASCARVKARLGHLLDPTACACVFDGKDAYPSPNLHARDVEREPRATPEAQRPVEELLSTLGRLMERHALIEKEITDLRRIAVERLAALPGGRYQDLEGTWWVEDHEGIPAVVYKARSA